jgi:hypothetical protein
MAHAGSIGAACGEAIGAACGEAIGGTNDPRSIILGRKRQPYAV